MACITCSRSATASPTSDRTIVLPSGRATLKVPAGTFAQSVSARVVDSDDMPDLTKAVLVDAVEARILTRQNQVNKVWVSFANIDYQTYDPTLVKVYQGKSIVDPVGWTPVPPGIGGTDILKDANGRVIGAKIMLSAGHLVVLTEP